MLELLQLAVEPEQQSDVAEEGWDCRCCGGGGEDSLRVFFVVVFINF